MINGTIYSNIIYGLKQEPLSSQDSLDKVSQSEKMEAMKTGNSMDSFKLPWVEREEDIYERIKSITKALHFDEQIVHLGLYMTMEEVSKDLHDHLIEKILSARSKVMLEMEKNNIVDYIAVFHAEEYNKLAPVIENILFGSLKNNDPVSSILQNDLFRAFIEKEKKEDFFVECGMRAIILVLDVFGDLPPGHELLQKLDFLDSQDMGAL